MQGKDIVVKGKGKDTIPDFEMPFQPMVIEHLGLRLYSTLPPVMSELVSNAYDAESAKVEITLPKGNITQSSEAVVRDYGHGMNADELQKHYLPIARPRRGEDNSEVMSKNGKRYVTGRKGLGKLAGFGVAKEMDIRSIADGQSIAIRLNYDEMLAWAKRNPNKPYKPTVLKDKCGPTTDHSGVEVTLRKFRRKTPIDPEDLKSGLARRLTLIDLNFEVFINGEPVEARHRFQKADCVEDQCWDASQLPKAGQVSSSAKVTGWCGFVATSSQTNRGINLYAKRKAVELGTFFNYSGTDTQFARAYLVGELYADFLDGDNDLVATARNSVVWESNEGQALQAWGQETIKFLFREWLKKRKKKKEEVLFRHDGFEAWLKKRTKREQNVARKMVDLLIEDDETDPEKIKPLLEVIKASVETVAYGELLDAMEEEGATPFTLLKLFNDWRIIEAREHLTVADGRQKAIQHLTELMDRDALEVKDMQPLIEKNAWLLDSAWTEVDGQSTYTKKLRQHAKEGKNVPEEDRRMDIFAVTGSGALTIVEIKRPGKTVSREDITQIEAYCDWAELNLRGTGRQAPNVIAGLLVIGKLNPSLQPTIPRLLGRGIEVITWEDIRQRASDRYREIEARLEAVAPDYLKQKRATASATKNAIEG